MAMHTPGPWQWTRTTESERGLRRTVACLLQTEHRPVPFNDPTILAMREDWLRPVAEVVDEHEANLRLIAAAPDLLAGLVALADAYENGCDDRRAPLFAARAAIAKATGEG